MKEFLFKCPAKIVYGIHAAQNLKGILTELQAAKIFIVTDKVLEKTQPVIDAINKLREDGFTCTVFSDTVVDPSIEVVDAAAKSLKESKSDAVIAIGGGSSIDTTKAMSMLVTNEGSVR